MVNDIFDQNLWKLATDNPELQQAIVNARQTRSGYSIPTGDINIYLDFQSLISDQKKSKLAEAVDTTRSLTIREVDFLLRKVQQALILSEAEGHKLTAEEKTMKDIDLTALATFIVVKWMAIKTQEKDAKA